MHFGCTCSMKCAFSLIYTYCIPLCALFLNQNGISKSGLGHHPAVSYAVVQFGMSNQIGAMCKEDGFLSHPLQKWKG